MKGPRPSAPPAASPDPDAAPEGMREPVSDEPPATQPPQDPMEERTGVRRRDVLTPVMREIRDTEERSLKEWLDGLGVQGSFKIQLRRESPEKVQVRGKTVNAAGHLMTYDCPIDEDFIQQEYGGGTYSIKAMLRSNSGSFTYQKGHHRTIKIAGEPRLDNLPGQAADAPMTGESPTIVREAFSAMKDMLDTKGGPKGPDPTVQMMFQQFREDGERRDREIQRRDSELAALRREVAEARQAPTVQDPIRDKMLNSLIDGQSGHVEALKLRHEAELRQLKESMREAEQRLEDRHDRAMSELRVLHESTLSNLRSSHERELGAFRASHDTALKAEQATHTVQVYTLNAEIKRLEQSIAEIKSKIGEQNAEIRDLRAKKDKSLVEQAKEIREVRDALSDGEGDKSGVDKILDLVTNPASLEFVQGIMTKRGAAPAAAPPQQGPRHVRNGRGEVFKQHPDGSLVALKPKPKPTPPIINDDGTQIQPPEIEPAIITQVVAYLERAFSANQSPEIVAQSGRTVVPEEIMTWIRNNHTEQVSGVDLFMSKVAKLPGTSPLSTQRGRNWLRMVGAALVGG